MGWFNRKKAERTAERVQDSQSYDAPSHAQNPPPYVYHGGAGWAPGHDPTVQEQWATNDHYYDTQFPGQVSFWPQENTLHADEGLPVTMATQSRAPDPRWVPVTPSRQTITPSNYSFMRPFQQWGARELNGNRFSMASNVRAYQVGGMQPAKERNRRNTYRVEPAPWDENIVDLPKRVNDIPQAVYISPMANTYSRTYRM